MMNTLIAWLYWDPPLEAFTIPYFNHPVVWYGILFVAGLIFAYFIIHPIFIRFLKSIRVISSFDVTNWGKVAKIMQSSQHPLIIKLLTSLDPAIVTQLKTGLVKNYDQKFQQQIIDGINLLLLDEIITREELNILFEDAITNVGPTAYLLADKLCWFIVGGTIIGARLGAVFFYDWDYFSQHPEEIFKIWHGGLASHGGTLGVLAALFLFFIYTRKYIPQLSFLRLLDFVAIPSAITACFIRLGNFMNQEILGTPTTLPWGIIFGHPRDNSPLIPRHPVQLYEAIAYFFIFIFLWKKWKQEKESAAKPGEIVGLLFILVFSSRFILEFWKETQESIISHSYFLQMGQILSIPFIFLGFFFFWNEKFFSKFQQRVF